MHINDIFRIKHLHKLWSPIGYVLFGSQLFIALIPKYLRRTFWLFVDLGRLLLMR
jgi:hypothetical protein